MGALCLLKLQLVTIIMINLLTAYVPECTSKLNVNNTNRFSFAGYRVWSSIVSVLHYIQEFCGVKLEYAMKANL
jgi:hypothetical protein